MRADKPSTLYLRMLSRSAAKAMPDWRTQPLPFALVSDRGHIERTGEVGLTSLTAFIARVRRVVLILAASDVTLLRMAVPPLSSARLKVALPALVEDRLITDPAECVLAVGPDAAGMRTIAVIERDWLREVVDTLTASGARRLVAYAAQTCLLRPASGATVSAAITQVQDHIDLALRLSEHEGMGLPLLAGDRATDNDRQIQFDVCHNLQTLTAHRSVELMVPPQQKEMYQHVVDQLPAGGGEIVIVEDHWKQWISGAEQAVPDLMSGLEAASSQIFSWRIWRWPVLLMTLLMSLNVIALYLQWWQLKNEGNAIRASMTRMYQTAFPDEHVIVDPLTQLQQKISAIHQAKGEVAPDDFLMLTAILAEALNKASVSSGNEKNNVVAALDYRNAALQVRFRPGAIPSLTSVRTALSARNFNLTVMPEQDKAVVWQIRKAQ